MLNQDGTKKVMSYAEAHKYCSDRYLGKTRNDGFTWVMELTEEAKGMIDRREVKFR